MRINLYHHSNIIKRLLLLGALVVILVLLTYTQKIVSRLREDSTNYVRFYAKVHVKAVTDQDTRAFDFIFDELIQGIPFPMIISSQPDSLPTSWRGLDIRSDDPADIQREVMQYMRVMDKTYPPIPLEYEDRILGYIHYGDTRQIRQLRMLPYIEIAVVGLFVLLAYIGFQVIRSSEKRSIWVGMAKETAHQLGTPLSSMMGWIELLKAKHNQSEELREMSNDLQRLEKVSSRFSKIGSRPAFRTIAITPIIHDAVLYYRKRLPQLGAQLRLEFRSDNDYYASLNSDLFSWTIENLIRNAIDAVPPQNGKITITTSLVKNDQFIAVDVCDNGRGITKKNRHNIFKPGYSTKKRGWGLGLSLAKRIIEEYHHGKIFVLESKPFERTVLRIFIRRASAEASENENKSLHG